MTSDQLTSKPPSRRASGASAISTARVVSPSHCPRETQASRRPLRWLGRVTRKRLVEDKIITTKWGNKEGSSQEDGVLLPMALPTNKDNISDHLCRVTSAADRRFKTKRGRLAPTAAHFTYIYTIHYLLLDGTTTVAVEFYSGASTGYVAQLQVLLYHS